MALIEWVRERRPRRPVWCKVTTKKPWFKFLEGDPRSPRPEEGNATNEHQQTNKRYEYISSFLQCTTVRYLVYFLQTFTSAWGFLCINYYITEHRGCDTHCSRVYTFYLSVIFDITLMCTDIICLLVYISMVVNGFRRFVETGTILLFLFF